MSFVNYQASNFSNPNGIHRQRPVETRESMATNDQVPDSIENVTLISDDSDVNNEIISLCDSEDALTEYSDASSDEMVVSEIDEEEQISNHSAHLNEVGIYDNIFIQFLINILIVGRSKWFRLWSIRR